MARVTLALVVLVALAAAGCGGGGGGATTTQKQPTAAAPVHPGDARQQAAREVAAYRTGLADVLASYSTAQRSGELGMRMALGARQSQVMWLVLKQGVVLTLVGGTAGLVGGFGLSRVLASLMPRLPSPERRRHFAFSNPASTKPSNPSFSARAS